MDIFTPTAMFAALSQQTRLDVFRLLIKAGRDGLLSGEIGERLNVRQNTMSANLAILHNTGLIRNERHGRTVRYFANFPVIEDLLRFLLEDCCGGDSAMCAPVMSSLCLNCEDQK